MKDVQLDLLHFYFKFSDHSCMLPLILFPDLENIVS